MKKLCMLFCFGCNTVCFAQQNLPFTSLNPILSNRGKGNELTSAESHNFFSFYGVGNLSDETLNKLNGGGKLAIGFNTNGNSGRLLPGAYYLSFNKNATNNDSVLVSTLVFPESGNHSFLATALWSLKSEYPVGSNLQKHANLFFEFATKQIVVQDSVKLNNTKNAFQTLHYTAGLRYTYGIEKENEERDKNKPKYHAAIGMLLFVSNTNIPDEDHSALETIINGQALKNNFWSAGVKIGIEINGFQIFADLRHVFGNEKKLPIKDLKGFNSNIGVAFNTEIFRL